MSIEDVFYEAFAQPRLDKEKAVEKKEVYKDSLGGEEAIDKCLSILADGGWLEQRQGVVYVVSDKEDWRIEFNLFRDLHIKGYITAHESKDLDRFVISEKGKERRK